jgi:hypothetical protein
MSAKQTIDELQLQNRNLLKQIEREQSKVFQHEDTIKELNEKLAERRHSEQMAGWAIDRAIETIKMDTEIPVIDGLTTLSGAVVAIAALYAQWCVNSSANAKTETKPMETVQ